jgi:C-terminal processing protease CtpA/Prc
MKTIGSATMVCWVLLAACAAPTPTATLAPTETTASAATPTAEREMSPEAEAYLEAALDIMEANGLYRLTVNWPPLRRQARRMAGGAQSPADTYDAIGFVLRAAGGKHSFLVTPEQAAADADDTMADYPPPRAKVLLGRLGFVAIEGFGSGIPEEGSKYATLIQQLIREVDAHSPCGWLVDLRENTGGNMYPMLAGLGPILGEGVAGQFLDPEGLVTSWSYQDGQSFYADESATKVSGEPYRLQTENPPVAVLTGRKTASSGEAVAISFRGRPNTRSFGLETAGFSTGNDTFRLSDGAVMVLTGVVMADRTGQAYGERIPPDEEVDERLDAMIEDEAIPQRAVDWLLAQSACTAQS